MMIPRDKRQHIIGGAMVALGTLAVLWVAQRFGAPAALALAGAAVGFGFEALQRFRGEGSVELQDALATTVGACAVAAGLQWGWPIIQRGIA